MYSTDNEKNEIVDLLTYPLHHALLFFLFSFICMMLLTVGIVPNNFTEIYNEISIMNSLETPMG